MTEEDILAQWKSTAGDPSTEPWTKDRLVGFFQLFRPHGEKLVPALHGLVGANEILPRLMEVYQVTAPGWDETDAYFLVKKPQPLSKVEAKRLASAHLENIAGIARVLGNQQLLRLLEPIPDIEVIQGSTPWPPSQDDPECAGQGEMKPAYLCSE